MCKHPFDWVKKKKGLPAEGMRAAGVVGDAFFAQAEVGEADVAIAIQQNVLWLQVPDNAITVQHEVLSMTSRLCM